ncbi:hypothetical protein ACR3H8_20000 [Pseudomonas aeruginosa]|nr:hypothetical protein [Pseudomonas aeruginosa]EIU2716124.1 hypothetical protein [Pseudomonas aeruginosa]EIU2863585.1 hypothetical protein [Pseudomonas aeruginosa]ELD5772796.1 hypothetical protein [Pseudomonas aeruginosa]MBA5210132.1 hypothetical protein [Pseudomonas aeruginosa]MBG3917535.1 hypothetical protein [Pseudomonas aeruginosa]
MRANPIAAAALAALMNIHAVAADATSTTNPTMTSRTAIKGTGCARNYEEAFTTAGTPLTCQNGVWRSAGQNGWVEVQDIFYRTAATNFTTVVRYVNCPAGKIIVGGSCNFNGGTNQHKKPITGAGSGPGGNYATCSYSLGSAFDPSDPNGLINTLVSTAFCIDAP